MTARCAADMIHDITKQLCKPFLNDDENAAICEALADINQEMSADLTSLMHDVFCFGHMVGFTEAEDMRRRNEQEEAERANRRKATGGGGKK